MKYFKLKNYILNFFKPKFRKKNLLKTSKIELNVVDVGSTGGLDVRWNLLTEFIRVYSFDPDHRAKNNETSKNKVFSFALWSSEKTLVFNLTSFPDASSTFIPNDQILENYLNHDHHRVIDKKQIFARSLDSFNQEITEIDFLKIDTEGAELEILKGSQNYLKNSILGMELEVQFVERTIGSPLFADIENYLRPMGFQLMNLSKESWIRKNNLWNINANPQLIWANAVYILNEDKFINKLVLIEDPMRKSKLLYKYIMICMVYGFYDYAISILQKIKKKNLLDEEIHIYENLVKSNVFPNSYILFLNLLKFITSIILLIFMPLLWRRRKSLINFFKSSATSLIYSIYSIFSRGGPYNVAITDFIK